ncbi:MAG: Gfo/Idh/MocA family oxidoreductase [Faecalimonas sp.]|nr:Gfo/Idh/MocA family oxidoreductase [Faecalimonas sp.]
MTMKMGIIGYGGMAHWHKDVIEGRIKGLSIQGIWDIKEEARDKARSEGLRVYDSQEELLNDDEITFVLIATPNDVHAPIAIDTMCAGKHVVCEKPITVSSELLEEMITVSEETGMFLTVHQNRRWDKDFCTLKRVLEDGTLGDVFRIESRVHGSRGISNTWRRVRAKGGGVLLDWGVHLFDQILLLKKGVRLQEVHARFNNVTTNDVEDGFIAFLTFEDGLQVIVEVGTSNFISLPRWYVLGNNGTAEIMDWDANGRIVCAKGASETDVVPVITPSGYTKTMAPRRDDTICEMPLPVTESDIGEFYRNVMAVIEGKAEPLIHMDEVRDVVKLMEAVVQSATRHMTIENPLGF